MQTTLAGTSGAAGTIYSLWRSRNISGAPCSSYGFPGMDFHTSAGWLNVHVHRTGFNGISGTPQHVVVAPGHSMYFESSWSDVAIGGTSCRAFDRLKITLPNNFVSVVITESSCVDPTLVDVSPVTGTRPPI
jgi:Protein of unknown function (DUF4232)